MSETLSFGPGDEESCVNITIIDDDITEPTERFQIVLQPESDLITTMGQITHSSIFIMDDDSKSKIIRYLNTCLSV